MKKHLLKLVTIIAEDILEEKILPELITLGAHGYTVTKAWGQGSHTLRASEWEGENIRIEILVNPDIADKILEHLSEKYFKYHGVVAYLSTVEVLRNDKF